MVQIPGARAVGILHWWSREVLGYSQLDVQEQPLLLTNMDPPDAVLPLRIGLWPVWGQDHTGHSSQLPPARGCMSERQAGLSRVQGMLVPAASITLRCWH